MTSQSKTRRGRRRLLIPAILLVAVVAAVGFTTWYKFFRTEPQEFSSEEERFKYGSIGTEEQDGIPYWIWLALPRVFPEHLPGPGGYYSLGVAWEEGQETPVGFSKRTIGFPRVGITCAACHAATYRTSPDAKRQVVPTGPTVQFSPQAYVRFLSDCASDPRFTADNLMPEINYNTELSWLDKLLYRYVIIPRTRTALLEQNQRLAWTYSRPLWGPGRIDPFNPVKFGVLKLKPADDATVGNSDVQPIWNFGQRDGVSLHWDGLNTSLTEVILSGAIGDGTAPTALPVARLKDLETYLRAKSPPPYPFRPLLDENLITRGAEVYQSHCAECHAADGRRTRSVIPLDEVRTDRHRLDMWTEEATRRYNDYAESYSWDFDAFVKTNGYVAVPLDGLWLRAPYLHNGSVPTLEALLETSGKRPAQFYRGYDVYIPGGSGFVHSGLDAERHGFRYDTRLQGNSNVGHEGPRFGTELPDGDKKALVEFLKTL